jgi:hypothetical protein
MFVERDVGAGIELEQASHLTALGILVKHLDRNFFEAGWLQSISEGLRYVEPPMVGVSPLGLSRTTLMIAPWSG